MTAGPTGVGALVSLLFLVGFALAKPRALPGWTLPKFVAWSVFGWVVVAVAFFGVVGVLGLAIGLLH